MRKKHPTIKKDDKVIVLAGKEKGKIATVLKVDAEKKRVLGLNLLYNPRRGEYFQRLSLGAV